MNKFKGTLAQITQETIGLQDGNHPINWDCLECGESVARTAAVDVIHLTVICNCDFAEYEHLTSRACHAACYVKKRGDFFRTCVERIETLEREKAELLDYLIVIRDGQEHQLSKGYGVGPDRSLIDLIAKHQPTETENG